MLLLLALGTGFAQDTATPPPPIVSGTQVGAGRYDDAVALLNGGEFVCTGVLIGPKTVLATALCVSEASHAIVGSKDWTSAQGELLPVATFDFFDTFQNNGMDLGFVTLTRASAAEPRPIAGACADEFIVPGAEVVFAGFGALRPDEIDPNTRLNEAYGELLSLDCHGSNGCDGAAPLDSEFIAGSEGVGPCDGDEGSPAYLVTPHGDVLLGIASRNTDDASENCGEPWIFTRVPAFRGWLEDEANDELPFPVCPGSPILTVQPFDPVGSGGSGRTTYSVEDADNSEGHSFSFAAVPEHGRIDLLTGQRILYRADPGFVGDDRFALEVRDPDGNGAVVWVDVEIVQKGFLGCGCTSTGPTSWLSLGLLPLIALRRRRQALDID